MRVKREKKFIQIKVRKCQTGKVYASLFLWPLSNSNKGGGLGGDGDGGWGWGWGDGDGGWGWGDGEMGGWGVGRWGVGGGECVSILQQCSFRREREDGFPRRPKGESGEAGARMVRNPPVSGLPLACS